MHGGLGSRITNHEERIFLHSVTMKINPFHVSRQTFAMYTTYANIHQSLHSLAVKRVALKCYQCCVPGLCHILGRNSIAFRPEPPPPPHVFQCHVFFAFRGKKTQILPPMTQFGTFFNIILLPVGEYDPSTHPPPFFVFQFFTELLLHCSLDCNVYSISINAICGQQAFFILSF